MSEAPAPIHDAAGVTLYAAEALATLPHLADESVDAVITDPPYSSGGLHRSDRNADPHAKYVSTGTQLERPSFSGDNRDGRSWAYWYALWGSQCLRLLKEGGYFLTFCDWRQLPLTSDAMQAAGLVWRGLIVWDKGPSARAPHTGFFRPQCEFIAWGTKGTSKTAHGRGPWPGVYHFPVKQSDKHHVTGKPTPLMRKLVQCCPPDGLVLDPFAGSGTTILAAALEGRRAIGIEQSAAYCQKTIERLAELRQTQLF